MLLAAVLAAVLQEFVEKHKNMISLSVRMFKLLIFAASIEVCVEFQNCLPHPARENTI